MTKKELLILADSLKNQVENTKQEGLKNVSKVKQIINRYDDQIVREDIMDYLLKVANIEQVYITENIICNIHRMIDNSNETGGSYRKIPAQVVGRKEILPVPEELPRIMEHFIGQINTSKRFFHPIEFSAYVYKRFLDIYPFTQYNETVAYYLLNLVLIRAGYGGILINPVNEQGYSEALSASQYKLYPDMELLVELVANCVVKELLKHNDDETKKEIVKKLK